MDREVKIFTVVAIIIVAAIGIYAIINYHDYSDNWDPEMPGLEVQVLTDKDPAVLSSVFIEEKTETITTLDEIKEDTMIVVDSGWLLKNPSIADGLKTIYMNGRPVIFIGNEFEPEIDRPNDTVTFGSETSVFALSNEDRWMHAYMGRDDTDRSLAGAVDWSFGHKYHTYDGISSYSIMIECADAVNEYRVDSYITEQKNISSQFITFNTEQLSQFTYAHGNTLAGYSATGTCDGGKMIDHKPNTIDMPNGGNVYYDDKKTFYMPPGRILNNSISAENSLDILYDIDEKSLVASGSSSVRSTHTIMTDLGEPLSYSLGFGIDVHYNDMNRNVWYKFTLSGTYTGLSSTE